MRLWSHKSIPSGLSRTPFFSAARNSLCWDWDTKPCGVVSSHHWRVWWRGENWCTVLVPDPQGLGGAGVRVLWTPPRPRERDPSWIFSSSMKGKRLVESEPIVLKQKFTPDVTLVLARDWSSQQARDVSSLPSLWRHSWITFGKRISNQQALFPLAYLFPVAVRLFNWGKSFTAWRSGEKKQHLRK